MTEAFSTVPEFIYNRNREVFRMSKWDKLLARICILSKDLRIVERKREGK